MSPNAVLQGTPNSKDIGDLGFQRVRLTHISVSPRFGATLEVSGDASLNDATLVSLVRRALAYRKTDGAIVKLGEHVRPSVKIGQPVWARVDDETMCTRRRDRPRSRGGTGAARRQLCRPSDTGKGRPRAPEVGLR
jgi:hypothetical protein